MERRHHPIVIVAVNAGVAATTSLISDAASLPCVGVVGASFLMVLGLLHCKQRLSASSSMFTGTENNNLYLKYSVCATSLHIFKFVIC